MVMTVIGEDFQGIIPAVGELVREILGILRRLDEKIHTDLTIELMLDCHIQYFSAQLGYGQEFLQNLFGIVLHIEHPLGLGTVGTLRTVKISLVGGENVMGLCPHQGDVLHDDLTADTTGLGQSRSGQGSAMALQHLQDLHSAIFTSYHFISPFLIIFFTIFREDCQINLDKGTDRSIIVFATDKTAVITEMRHIHERIFEKEKYCFFRKTLWN